MYKKILILMSDTGGGHRAAAQAIEEAIHHLCPNQFEVVIEDIWIDHTRWPLNRLPNAYPWLSDSGTRWWLLIWNASKRRRLRHSVLRTANLLVQRKIVRLLNELQPDIVVSVHPAMTYLAARWVEHAHINAPFYTVVTDMVTVHPAWVYPEVAGCMVSTPPARDQAIAYGISPDKVAVCGQPVGLKFARLAGEKQELRQQLNMDRTRPAVLIVGGGEGIGRVYDIAREIAQRVPQAQLIVVAGRNKELKQRLENVAWEIPAHIFGFVHNMPELMGAADILITKGGPGTISEAFIAGLPVIISGYIPGQEAGNVQYVLENEAGAYATEPTEIATLVHDWLTPGNETLTRMMQNAARLARPNASLEIARHICGLTENPETVRRETVMLSGVRP
ncbi:MAG: glycosyltransferase [Anaerolineales bacterium]|nr:glycosyltransferase [Anaerolineales bacterium]